MRRRTLRIYMGILITIIFMSMLVSLYYKRESEMLSHELDVSRSLLKSTLQNNQLCKEQVLLLESELVELKFDPMMDINVLECNSSGKERIPDSSEVLPSEKPSPQDFVSQSKINVYGNRVMFYVSNPVLTKFTDTNSMDPLFDSSANGIEIRPKYESDISIGDVISYNVDDTLFVHRVVEIGYDDKGWYAFVKGDNEVLYNLNKIRFEQVNGILVAIIY